jgi:hypothetical protein
MCVCVYAWCMGVYCSSKTFCWIRQDVELIKEIRGGIGNSVELGIPWNQHSQKRWISTVKCQRFSFQQANKKKTVLLLVGDSFFSHFIQYTHHIVS